MSAYGLLTNPYLFDPKQGVIEWTPKRGIRASLEYLQFAEKYGVPEDRNECEGVMLYHLNKLNAELREKNPNMDLLKDCADWGQLCRQIDRLKARRSLIQNVSLCFENTRSWKRAKLAKMNAKYDQFFKHTLGSPVYILAPKDGIYRPNLPIRMIARRHGGNMCFTARICVQHIIESFNGSGGSLGGCHLDKLMSFHQKDRPLIVPLSGRDLEEITFAAMILKQLDVCDGIEIFWNKGASSIRRSMIATLTKSCALPVVARINVMPTIHGMLKLTDKLVAAGVSMLVVHARECWRRTSSKTDDLNMIRIIKQHYRRHKLTIPIVCSGNAQSLQHARDNLEFTGCDAIISEELLTNPYLFDRALGTVRGPKARIKACWEYLDFVEKYGYPAAQGAVVGFHLNGLMSCHKWTLKSKVEWIAFIELMEIEAGFKDHFEKTKIITLQKVRKYAVAWSEVAAKNMQEFAAAAYKAVIKRTETDSAALRGRFGLELKSNNKHV